MNIGIVGGGQLARMLALAGLPLGMRFHFVDPNPECCAAPLGTLTVASYDDEQALAALAERCDVCTFDFENVPAQAMEKLESMGQVRPTPKALLISQDRLEEKNFFSAAGFSLPAYQAVNSLEDLRRAAEQVGLPAVLKTRRLGYDGKGQRVLRDAADLEPAFQALGTVPLILEAFVAFRREVSLLAVRDARGQVRFWPWAENVHQQGILYTSRSGPFTASRQEVHVRGLVRQVLDQLDYVGVAAFEFFDTGEQWLLNEMAPRVHNSGHWTIEGAVTSQFENHLRAIAGLPLGDTRAVGHSLMRNWVGELPDRDACLALPGLHWHDYDKAPRPGRKVGHATLVADDPETLAATTFQLDQLLRGGGFRV